jgi:methylmalonyl-CoA mutase N-terminal domain/subunit
MNCAFTQLVGPAYKANTTFFPIDYAVKLGLDLMEYCIKNLPKWNILNINAYNMRETGIDGVQEIAFTIALAMDYMDLLIERGLSVDDFGKRIAVFAAVHLNFLEEVAKLRAMRRLWAKMMKDLYGASDDVCRLKIAVQTSALPLTAQQPLNNIVRISIQTLAAVLAGVQSIHTTGYDEAYSLPTELSHELSLRTQQIIAYETDVAKTADPLGGSYAIEWLTDELEERALNLIDKIKGMGGFIECFKKGWIEEQINDARFKYWRRIEDGEKVVVGINAFRKVEEDVQIQIFRDENLMRKVLEDRLNYIKRYRRGRDEQKVKDALDKLYGKAVGEREINLMEFVINAVKSGATLQEVIDVFRVAKNFSIPGGLIWS